MQTRPIRAGLEQELRHVLRTVALDERQARAVTRRLGWDGSPRMTLTAAGRLEGYSRERVRQLEQRVLAFLADSPPRLPATEAAVAVLERSAPATRAEGAVALAAAGLAARPFDPAGVMAAAEAARLTVRVRLGRDVLVRKEHEPVARAAVSLARRLSAQHGAARLRDVRGRLHPGAPSLQGLRRLLELHAPVTWLDDRRDWLVLAGQETRAGRLVRRMLSVATVLGVDELADGLRRATRPIALPPPVLRALLASLDWIDLDESADTVSARVPLDPGRVLPSLERLLVDVFRTWGPVLSLNEALELAAAAGGNPNSVGIYLCKAPVICKVGRGRYALRGHDPRKVSLRPARAARKVVLEAACAL